MNQRRCIKVASRIDAGLRAELGEGIDALRMVAEPLYARDVLLVCDAMVGSELQSLSSLYRQAAAQDSARPLLRRPLSIGGLLNSLFGTTEAGATRLRPAPGATARRLQPPGRPRRTAIRPPHRLAAR